MTALHTRFCELVGIERPIVQTGMGWVSGARLTAATSAAGGFGILAGPSAGYIIAFPIAAFVVGWLATLVIRRTAKARALWFFLAATATSIVFVHTLGIIGIAMNSKATLEQAFLSDLVFYPGDVVKNVLAAAIAVALHRAFPDVLVRRVRRRILPAESA